MRHCRSMITVHKKTTVCKGFIKEWGNCDESVLIHNVSIKYMTIYSLHKSVTEIYLIDAKSHFRGVLKVCFEIPRFNTC